VKVLLLAGLILLAPALAAAQAVSQRGFVEGGGLLFPQEAPNDDVRAVGDLLAREELFAAPTPWIRFAAGLDVRANSHDQVDRRWRLDFADRGIRRPPLSIRRLSTTLSRGRFTLDAGKQFIRWGKTDIVTPTDRFAPRDFINVVDNDFLAITAVRAAVAAGAETFEAVWEPRLTPSRLPLVNERWTAVPPAATTGGNAASLGTVGAVSVVDAGTPLPSGSSAGVRWSHVGEQIEYSLSVFDGLDHLPVIQSTLSLAPAQVTIERVYPRIRVYGGDLAVPTRWVTVKAESAYVTSPSPLSDEYVQYVLQIERQTGEWMLIGGYAGEAVTAARSPAVFAPDRGLSRAFVARASYTIDANRSAAFEGAVRQNGRGVYAKAEYSQARGQHWRATLAGVAIAGAADDFLGQYRRNSHATLTLRYSF
jgi:hypothetical protein